MPHVNVRLVPDGITPQQKSEVIAGITDVLVKVLGKDREGISIVIDEVDAGNWGLGGRTVAERRRNAKRQEPPR